MRFLRNTQKILLISEMSCIRQWALNNYSAKKDETRFDFATIIFQIQIFLKVYYIITNSRKSPTFQHVTLSGYWQYWVRESLSCRYWLFPVLCYHRMTLLVVRSVCFLPATMFIQLKNRKLCFQEQRQKTRSNLQLGSMIGEVSFEI